MADSLVHHFRGVFVELTSLAREKPLWFYGGAAAVVLSIFLVFQLRVGRGRGRA